MPFSSLDHLISKTSRGSSRRSDFTLSNPVTALGRWYDFSLLGNRSHPRNLFSGTSLTWTSCNETAGNGTEIFGLPHGGNVASETKHIINASIAAFNAIGIYMLVDLQGYWPGINTNSNAQQNLSGTPTLRYNNGEGCRLYFVQTVAAGATPANISVSYTNQGGTSGRSLFGTVAMTPSATQSQISHSGTSANNYGAFLPLASGDYGVQNVASVTFSAAMGAGTGALCLARPLLTIPAPTSIAGVDRDMLSYFPSTPRVYDGACLVWLHFSYLATTASIAVVPGHIDFAWG